MSLNWSIVLGPILITVLIAAYWFIWRGKMTGGVYSIEWLPLRDAVIAWFLVVGTDLLLVLRKTAQRPSLSIGRHAIAVGVLAGILVVHYGVRAAFKGKPYGLFYTILIWFYGRPLRLAATALAIILICGALYALIGVASGSGERVVVQDQDGGIVSIHEQPCLETSFRTVGAPALLQGLYLSVVTFTTLGYGDVRPLRGSRLVAAIEAALGFFIFSILISLLVSRFNDDVFKSVIERTLGKGPR
jgi:hypothetical protein